MSAAEDRVTLDEALQRCGGMRNPAIIEVCLAATSLWFAGAIAAMLPVFAHDVTERAGLTVAHEWSLTGSRLWMHDCLQTLFWAGFTVGLLAAGQYSDKKGRMPVFVVTGVAGVVSMALCSVAPNLPTYALLRALVGASYGGSGLVAFVGATETMSSSFGRAFIGTVGLNVFYITGEIVAVALGAVRGWGWERGWTWWRGLTLAASGVCATACLPAVLVFAESPRWLLSRGEGARAQSFVDAAARRYDALAVSLQSAQDGDESGGIISGRSGGAEGNEGDAVGGLVEFVVGCIPGNRARQLFPLRDLSASTQLAVATTVAPMPLAAARDDDEDDDGGDGGGSGGSGGDGEFDGNDEHNHDGDDVDDEERNPRGQNPPTTPPSSTSAMDAGVAPYSPYAQLYADRSMRVLTGANCFLWFATAFSYFGLNQASAQLVPSNVDVYLSVACLAFVEFPANVVAMYATESPQFGRRNTCAAAAAVGGACCVVVSFLQAAAATPSAEGKGEGGSLAAMAVLGLFGKLAVTVTFSSMYVLTGESYPTELRSAGVSTASTAARLGSMISPLFGFSVPAVASLLIWGIVLLVAAGSTTALIAETKGVDRDAESGAGAAGATSAASNGSESGGSEVIELSPSGSQRRRGGYSKGRQYDTEADVLMVEREGRPGGGAAISTGVRNALHGAGI